MFHLYTLYVLSFFLHLPERITFLGQIRFDLVLALLLLVVLFLKVAPRPKPVDVAPPTRALIILIIYVCVTLPAVEWPGSVIRFGLLKYYKAVLFFFFTILLVNTEAKLRTFTYLFIFCQLFRIAEPTMLHLTTGYWGSSAMTLTGGLNRLSGAPLDVINANQLAWIIVTTTAFLFYMGFQVPGKPRLLVLGFFSLLGYALLLTGSRSGLLSLLVLILIIGTLAKQKKRALLAIVFLSFPILLLSISLLAPSMTDRYLSIVKKDAANRVTIEGRISALEAQLSTVINRPIVGHGLGTSAEVNFNLIQGGQITHSLYIEVLQEIGVIGFIIFLYYIASIVKLLVKLRHPAKHGLRVSPFLEKVSHASLAWVLMSLFYGLTCFGLNSWEWYLFGGLSTTCYTLAKNAAHDKEHLFVKP